jgi:hypothetical protein
VDQLEYGKNHSYLYDFIRICYSGKQLNPEEITRLYVKERLSAAQISNRYGVAKSVIVSWLTRLAIAPGTNVGSKTNPNNYRHHNPPYGYKVQDGKLVLNKAELKICRLIVELIARRKFSNRAAARELIKQGLKNRSGKLSWSHHMVQQIFNRWKNKV